MLGSVVAGEGVRRRVEERARDLGRRAALGRQQRRGVRRRQRLRPSGPARRRPLGRADRRAPPHPRARSGAAGARRDGRHRGDRRRARHRRALPRRPDPAGLRPHAARARDGHRGPEGADRRGGRLPDQHQRRADERRRRRDRRRDRAHAPEAAEARRAGAGAAHERRRGGQARVDQRPAVRDGRDADLRRLAAAAVEAFRPRAGGRWRLHVAGRAGARAARGCSATGPRSCASSASFSSTAAPSRRTVCPPRFGASKLTSSSSRSITVVQAPRADVLGALVDVEGDLRRARRIASARELERRRPRSPAARVLLDQARVRLGQDRTKSSTDSEPSSTRIGKRPCSSGIRSLGLREVERAGGDEQDVVGLDRPVLGVDGRALDDRQQVALHALARDVGAVRLRARRRSCRSRR